MNVRTFCVGSIFLSSGRVQRYSPVVGEAITLNARVCEREMNKFHFMWNCNGEDLPSQTCLSYTFLASKKCTCICIALNPSSNTEFPHSEVFVVHPEATPPAC